MESYYGYDSKSRGYKERSPERRLSPSYSRHRSPSFSPRRWSPEHRRRRSPSYSPPSARNRSPSYHYRDRSPSYPSHDSRRRSSERSSRERRKRRSRERSPRGHSRYRSRGRSPSWPIAEKKSLSPDDSSLPSLESRKKERTVVKRRQDFISEENSDDEQECSVVETSDKLKVQESSKILKVSESIMSDGIFSKKRKMSVPEEKQEDTLHKSEPPPNPVNKIMHGLGISKQTSDPFTQNEKGLKIAQESPDSKEKRNEVMNSLLNKLGISSSISTSTTTVAPATSWTAPPTDSQATIPAAPQQLNINQYGIHYPQQLPSSIPQQLPSSVPQMYPQPYAYGSSVPPVPHFPPYNAPPPPMYPQPIPSSSAFNYPPPVPPVPNSFNTVNFQVNPRPTNPNSRDRICALKSIPVVKSNQPVPQSPVTWNQNIPLSPTNAYNAKPVAHKNFSAVPQDTDNSSAETEEEMIEKYRKLLEEKETLQKKLKNTSDHVMEIRNLQSELEKTTKLPKTSAKKQLNIKCSNLYDRTNEELKRYIDEAKRLNGQVKELQTKIKPETLDKIAKEVSEKKVSSSVKYAGYDNGNHWCECCNQHISNIPKMMEHLYSETHMKHVDPSKIITKEPPKESFDKNVKLWPTKGVEFMKPLFAFYCSLCDEILSNPSYAEHHLKGSSHIEKYMIFLNENPIYERKREVFKEAGLVALANEKKQKELEEIRLAKQLLTKDKEKFEIKRQKNHEALKTISDKLQQLKEKDKVSEELEESNLNARMSPQNQKAGLKLTLINEKQLETNISKAPELKPKPKVVYIGRAPNYKPRSKGTDKLSSKPSESKNIDLKDEEGKNSTTSSKVEDTPTDFSADDKIKSSKKLAGSTQSLSKSQTQSQKRVKNIPGCQSEAEAKESEKSSNQSVQSCEMPTENSEINEAIKNFIRSRKNATPPKVDLSDIKMPELPPRIPSPISNYSPKKLSPFSESNPKVSSPLSKPSPAVSPSLSKSSPKVSTPTSKPHPQVSSPLPKSSQKASPPLPSSPLASSPITRQKPLSEEEKDLLLLGICKSDMEPMAVPRPPPSNLIHNHSEIVPKFQPFPNVQIPPPNMVSKVPPPNIISQVPPPNIISQVPPPNIITQVPPPSITSSVPPPTLVLQWSSEQNKKNNSVLSNVPFSSKNIPTASAQFSHLSTVVENAGVMDMEIDNDLVCSEIKVVSSTEKKLSSSGKQNTKNPRPSSMSVGEKSAKRDLQQVLHSEVVTKENDPTPSTMSGAVGAKSDKQQVLHSDKVTKKDDCTKSSKSVGKVVAKSDKQQVLLSDVVTKEDDNIFLLKNFVSYLVDSVAEMASKNLKKEMNTIQSTSENLLLSSEKASELNEKFSNKRSNLNSEENISVEKNEKDAQKFEQLVIVSSEIAVQDEPFNNDMPQNVSEESSLEIEEISGGKEEGLSLTSTSKVAVELHDIKDVKTHVTSSDYSFETVTCELMEQQNDVLESTSFEIGTSPNNDEKITESERNSSNHDIIVSSKTDDTVEKINDSLVHEVIQSVAEENSKEMEVEQISMDTEEEILNSSSSKTSEEFFYVKEVQESTTKSCHSSETEICEVLEQKNDILSATPSDSKEFSSDDSKNKGDFISLNSNQQESNVNPSLNSSSSNTTCDITVSSETVLQHGAVEKICTSDSTLKDVMQNVSDENISKNLEVMEIDEIAGVKEEANFDLASVSKTETCEFSEQNNFVSTSCENEISQNNDEKDNESEKNSSGYNISVLSKTAVQYDTDEKMCINDQPGNDLIQNVSEENSSKTFQEMEIEEISVDNSRITIETNLESTSKTSEEFLEIKEVKESVTSSSHSHEAKTCEVLEKKGVLLSTSSDSKTSFTDENEINSFSHIANQSERSSDSLLTSSGLNTPADYEQNMSEEKEKIEPIEVKSEVAERSPISSPIIKTEVKEEKIEPIGTFQLENQSNQQSADIKIEMNTEAVDVLSKSNLSEDDKLDQKVPMKFSETSQVLSNNDFTSENVSNVNKEKEEIQLEDSETSLKKCDTEDTVNRISTDEQILLIEPEESSDNLVAEEFKGENNSDTDEYEAAEN